MSKLGIRWEIDGVPAAFIARSAINGRYRVTFERSEATLEQIEQINWSAPLSPMSPVLSRSRVCPSATASLWRICATSMQAASGSQNCRPRSSIWGMSPATRRRFSS